MGAWFYTWCKVNMAESDEAEIWYQTLYEIDLMQSNSYSSCNLRDTNKM